MVVLALADWPLGHCRHRHAAIDLYRVQAQRSGGGLFCPRTKIFSLAGHHGKLAAIRASAAISCSPCLTILLSYLQGRGRRRPGKSQGVFLTLRMPCIGVTSASTPLAPADLRNLLGLPRVGIVV